MHYAQSVRLVSDSQQFGLPTKNPPFVSNNKSPTQEKQEL